MQDTALYQDLSGLKSPWTVCRVNLDVKAQRVDVWAEHPEAQCGSVFIARNIENFQDGHLLLLRWTRSLPMLNPEVP